ncbi:trypsin-like isoform X2 [Antedon mediterranea]|uniref:trypsin-like isoform X2 n=1 Tax=Antedon mediterranea TaxID=105859 RepID=UPI003AF7B3FE
MSGLKSKLLFLLLIFKSSAIEDDHFNDKCFWGEWSSWSECNTNCTNAGVRKRTRMCSCSSATGCDGKDTQVEACSKLTCNPEGTEGCGTSKEQEPPSSRIVGGEDAAVGRWPWQAMLYNKKFFTCGGTLIGRKYVISAAHCFRSENPKPWRVNLGKNRLRKRVFKGNGEHGAEVSKIIIHPDYNSLTNDNDIALMVLEEDVPTDSDVINTACLDYSGNRIFDPTSSCVITGWGKTEFGGNVAEILQEAEVPIVDQKDCIDSYGSDITDNMICAGYLAGGVDTCQGDSGGPLVCTSLKEDNKEYWYLVGITSWGYGCATPNFPGVYTKVSNYINWIKENIDENP